LPFANSDYLYRAARALPPQQAKAALREAIRVNPTATLYYRTLANMEKHSPTPDVKALRSAYESALALDPNDVTGRLDYAQTLEKLGQSADAVAQYRIALVKNDLLAPDEPKRLPPAKGEELRRHLRDLGGGNRLASP